MNENTKLYETAEGLPPQVAGIVPGPLNGLRVCFQVADEAGCGGYRCILPAGQLRKYGADVKWTHRMHHGDYERYDVLVFQRPMEENLAHEMREISRLGKLVIVEADDNLHQVPANSPVFEHFKLHKLSHFTEALRSADGLIVSTPELARDYYPYNRNVVVSMNSIDLTLGFRDWSGTNDETGRQEGEVVVGWRGGATHQEDLLEMGPQVKRMMTKYPYVRLALYSGPGIAQWATVALGLQEFKDRITSIKPRRFELYPQGLSGIDILMIPLHLSRATGFNHAKSELALCEAGALGIPTVCSASAAYTRFAGENNEYAIAGGITKSPVPLNQTTPLDLLIENKSYREALGAKARERVLADYDLDKNVWTWVDAFNNIWEQKMAGNVGPGELPTSKAGKEDPCPGCIKAGVKSPPKFRKCKKHYGQR